VVRGERHDRVLQTDQLVHAIQQLTDRSIGPNRNIANLR